MQNGPRLRAISIMYSFFSKKIQKIVFDLQKFHKSGPTSVGFNWKKKKKRMKTFLMWFLRKKTFLKKKIVKKKFFFWKILSLNPPTQ